MLGISGALRSNGRQHFHTAQTRKSPAMWVQPAMWSGKEMMSPSPPPGRRRQLPASGSHRT